MGWGSQYRLEQKEILALHTRSSAMGAIHPHNEPGGKCTLKGEKKPRKRIIKKTKEFGLHTVDSQISKVFGPKLIKARKKYLLYTSTD